jgi:hypothetical protein
MMPSGSVLERQAQRPILLEAIGANRSRLERLCVRPRRHRWPSESTAAVRSGFGRVVVDSVTGTVSPATTWPSTRVMRKIEVEAAPPSAPAGWYPGPDIQQHYWDGRTWLSSAPADAATNGSGTEMPDRRPRRRRLRRRVIAGALSLVVLVGLGVAGIGVKNAHDAKQAAVIAAKEADAKATEAKAAEASRQKAAAEAAEAAAAVKRARDEAERKRRTETVAEIEDSVKKLAKKQVQSGAIDGPIISVSCDPVAGGSVEDLTEKTTAFQCFVANKDNGDGTLSGYDYHATMNWDSGSYTYGLGKD